MISVLQNILNIYCIIFCLWMSFRWSSKELKDSMIKVSLFLVSVLLTVIELKAFKIL